MSDAPATKPEGHAGELEVTIAARPETVFAFFTEADSFASWFGAARGNATIEPRVGGELRVDYSASGFVALGEVVALEPHRHFAFTWGYEGGRPFAPGSTRVDITLTPTDSGTHLVLRHSGLPSAGAAAEHRGGWRLYASVLANVSAQRQNAARAAELVTSWFAAWGETDADARLPHIAACMTDDGDFRHPYSSVTGHADLSGHIAASRQMMQGLTLEAGPHELVHDTVHYRWQATDPDGAVVASGWNVGLLAADGRFGRVLGFTDPPEAPTG